MLLKFKHTQFILKNANKLEKYAYTLYIIDIDEIIGV
jgi:hypothetical protein